MYVKQEMYFIDEDMLETILIPKNIYKYEYIWILGP
jgi:hypothetical protein